MDRLGRRVYNEGLSYNQRGEFHGDLFGEGPTPKPVQKPTAAPTIEPDAPCSVAGSRPFNGGTLHCVDIGEGQLVDVLRRRHAVLGLGVHYDSHYQWTGEECQAGDAAVPAECA